METTTMATPSNSPAPTEVRETPSQGIFIGRLALVLFIFAVAVAAFGLYAGASHGWQ
jgi:hypothetical protein